MEKIIQQYNENTITRAEYVKMMSHYYGDNSYMNFLLLTFLT
jgi:hypothetical protein